MQSFHHFSKKRKHKPQNYNKFIHDFNTRCSLKRAAQLITLKHFHKCMWQPIQFVLLTWEKVVLGTGREAKSKVNYYDSGCPVLATDCLKAPAGIGFQDLIAHMLIITVHNAESPVTRSGEFTALPDSRASVCLLDWKYWSPLEIQGLFLLLELMKMAKELKICTTEALEFIYYTIQMSLR